MVDSTKKVGRPRSSSPDKKRSDSRARQIKARRKQRKIKAIGEFLVTQVEPKSRQVWLEFLAWALDYGENLLVNVEWEGGGGTRHFSDLADQLIGDTEDRRGIIKSISFI